MSQLVWADRTEQYGVEGEPTQADESADERCWYRAPPLLISSLGDDDRDQNTEVQVWQGV